MCGTPASAATTCVTRAAWPPCATSKRSCSAATPGAQAPADTASNAASRLGWTGERRVAAGVHGDEPVQSGDGEEAGDRLLERPGDQQRLTAPPRLPQAGEHDAQRGGVHEHDLGQVEDDRAASV